MDLWSKDELARIVRPAEATRMLHRSRSSMWRDVRDGRLHPPCSLGPRARGWPLWVLLTCYGVPFQIAA